MVPTYTEMVRPQHQKGLIYIKLPYAKVIKALMSELYLSSRSVPFASTFSVNGMFTNSRMYIVHGANCKYSHMYSSDTKPVSNNE